MSFMAWVVERLNDISSWFYEIYLDVYGWAWPFYYTANYFYYLCQLFNTLAWDFYHFEDWCGEVEDKLGNYLSWDYIKSLILGWLPWLSNAGAWFQNWWSNVTSVVTSWWSATSVTVQGWISTATQYFNSVATAWDNFWNNLWPQLTSSFNSLKSAWDNFWKVTFPNLVSQIDLGSWWTSRLRDIQGLINTALRDAGSLAEGWQDMRSNVVTFFQDPVEFIWQRFADWFLGPEG